MTTVSAKYHNSCHEKAEKARFAAMTPEERQAERARFLADCQ